MKYKKSIDSKEFYFGRQNDYSKYRPEYPKELFEFLTENYNLKNKIIVELGAGTGKFSKLASSYCDKLYYIEPNLDMLNEGKKYCNSCNNIIFINSSAEETKVPENSSDIIFAVQSFHWFNKTKLKEEVKRILKEDGYFAIVWNDLEDENNEFSQEYFKYISDWNTKLTGQKYQHKNIEERQNFFKDRKYDTYTFIHSKKYTLKMLIGFSKSLSYAPKENDEYYEEFINGIINIFNKYQKKNNVTFDFHTEMYIGKI